MSKDLSLSEIFSNSTPSESQTETDAVETADVGNESADHEEVEQEMGEEEATPATKANDESKVVKGTVAAVKAERLKRQEIEKKHQESEARAKKLEDRLAALESGKPVVESKTEKAERPDVYEDPEGALNYSQAETAKQIFTVKYELSKEIMSEKHADYQELEDRFSVMVKEDPELLNKFATAKNPAKFAYETAKKDREIAQYSDPEYRTKLEQEIREKILAEMKGSTEAEDAEESDDAEDQKIEAKPKAKLPPSFAKATSAKSGDKFPEEKSLDDLFPSITKRK